MNRPLAVLTLAALASAGAAPPALADQGGGGDGDRAEVRVGATCSGAGKGSLKVKADDGGIEVEVEVEHVRAGSSWRIVVVQEGRVALRTTARASSTGEVDVERRIADLAGADTIRFRASGPNGASCRATATLPGS